MSNRGHIQRLLRRDNYTCHYCKKMTDAADGPGSPRYPTRDHIVPKAFGGENSLDNYVLSCEACNNKRGTSLFYCECRDCREKVYEAIYDRHTIDRILRGLVKHNKPKVFKERFNDDPRSVAGRGKWVVRHGHNRRHFYTFEEALAFVKAGAVMTKDNK